MVRKALALVMSATIVMSGCNSALTSYPTPPTTPVTPTTSAKVIKHVVVIFDENISFDHYFGTYPNAANSDGTPFTAAAGTPIPNNYISNPALLTANPNLNPANLNTSANSSPANPFRLSASQAGTADQDHDYGAEQSAFDGGAMDLFPLSVGTPNSSTLQAATDANKLANTTALTMGYYDGNTVTALWNYAQHYAMSDNSFGTTFGPSTVGALNLVSGQTNGAISMTASAVGDVTPDGVGGYTETDDPDPNNDVCSSSESVAMSGKNIGDLLSAANVTWGFFEGGFNLTATNPGGSTGCNRSTNAVNIPGHPAKADYIPHHEPFQYYASTANPNHNRPTSGIAIGAADPNGANHQYDTSDFMSVVATGNIPAVSFLKAPGYQDAHAGYSDPLDEQTWLVNTINSIESSPAWSSTAIIIAYDDSDGWYDHATSFVNGSATSSDSLNGAGVCISAAAAAAALPGPNSNGKPVGGRCGYGPRLPLLVISPWAQKNYIDGSINKNVTDQSSILRFIEDTFLGSQRIGGGSFDVIAGSLDSMFNFSNGAAPPNPNVVLLDPTTGKVTTGN